jgi:rSAM/selenodomain-associated transferase 1
MTDVLGIFAKWPEPGRVKTRLAEATSPTFAARVADALLRDTLDKFASTAQERWLAYAPDDAAADFARLADNRFQLISQGSGDLGERLNRFMRDRVAAGADHVVVVGADSPTLSGELVRQSFEELRTADVVLGPASDGGYYLVGCGRRMPPIFSDIPWGTSAVLRDTMNRLDDSWRIALLPPWYDMDTLDDWRLLQGHVAALRRAGVDPGCPRTERLLAEPPSVRG